MKYSVLTTSISNNFKHYKIFIHSINIQNPLPQELVFVNDGIKFEKIKDYLASLLNKKIKLVYHKNKINLGITKSLNLGIKKVNTKLIFRLDIDDEWLFNHSRVMLKEYKQDNNYLIYSNSSIGYIRGLADQNLLIDNPTIHSSWVINLHKKYNFKYLNYNPEDYATLSYYFQKNFRFKLVKKKL